jgi:arabinose-5-phosphate isomerase
VVLEDAALQDALSTLNGGGLGLVAVVDRGTLLKGVLTDGDVRRLVCAGALNMDRPVSEVMTVSPRRATAGESSARVLDLMERSQITVLPVVRDDGRLAGMVHLHDLLGKGELTFAGGNGGGAD